MLAVQLPDPRLAKNMKRRGTKKLTLERIVQPALAAVVARRMMSGGLVYFSSEYRPLALEMRRFFLSQRLFTFAPQDVVKRCRFLHRESGEGLGLGAGDIRCPPELLPRSDVGKAGAATQANEPRFWDGAQEADLYSDGGGSEPTNTAESLNEEHTEPWLDGNPFGCPTIREMFLYKSKRPVYRDLLVCQQGTFVAVGGHTQTARASCYRMWA